MGKTIEICHFKSFDRLLEKAEELERYFQPPAKPDEHYKLVFKKKRDAQVSDDHHVKVVFIETRSTSTIVQIAMWQTTSRRIFSGTTR